MKVKVPGIKVRNGEFSVNGFQIEFYFDALSFNY